MIKNRITKIKKKWIILIIFLAIPIVRSSFYEVFRIPSGSMIPTLSIGDFILVDKKAYGYKLPFSDLAFNTVNWDPIYLTSETNPAVGDVIVFKWPEKPTENYIKRVVALPGDTVEIKNKVIYVNDISIESESVDTKLNPIDLDEEFKTFNLKFLNTKNPKYTYVIDEDNYYKKDFAKTKIEKDHYFVMGDNRDYSLDSRYWGTVHRRFIKGKATNVIFSFKFPERERQSEKGSDFKLRLNRIGKTIQ